MLLLKFIAAKNILAVGTRVGLGVQAPELNSGDSHSARRKGTPTKRAVELTMLACGDT